MCEIYSKFTIKKNKKTEQRLCLNCSSVAIVNFEHVIAGWVQIIPCHALSF